MGVRRHADGGMAGVGKPDHEHARGVVQVIVGAEHAEEPVALPKPLGHAAHAADACAPVSALAVPTGHATGADEPAGQ